MQERKRQSSKPKATWPWGWRTVCRPLTVSGVLPTGPQNCRAPKSPEGAGWVPLSRGALPPPPGCPGPSSRGRVLVEPCWQMRGLPRAERDNSTHLPARSRAPAPARARPVCRDVGLRHQNVGVFRAHLGSQYPPLSICMSQFTGMCGCGLGAHSTFCTYSLFR